MYRTRSLYTTAGFQVHQNLFWQMLTDDQCEAVVSRAKELLERTGVEIPCEKAQQAFKDAGCFVEGSRVRIPSAKSEWALRVAPSRVTMCDRNGKRAALLEATEAHYAPGYTAEMYMDQENDETLRPFVLADVEETAKLVDSLPKITFAMTGGCPTDADEVASFKVLAKTTTKPVIQNAKSADAAKAIIELATAIAGSAEKLAVDPYVALLVEVDEALQFSAEALGVIALAAEKRVPVVINNKLVSGLTAPAESAGVMIVALANTIAAITLAQLVAEGAPVVAGGFFTNNDTVNGMLPYGSPEISLLGGGFANIMRYLRLPSMGFAGATDSKCSDAQMGMETALSTLCAGVAGTNVIVGAGTIESGIAYNPNVLVLVDELAAETERIMRGVEMDEDRLARGVIEYVQPAGNYLATKHTRYYFRSEQFWPTLMNRKRIDDWQLEGSLTLGQRTINKAKNLLASFDPKPLADDVAKLLD